MDFLVSIIVPVYNTEKYLATCIDSIQTGGNYVPETSFEIKAYPMSVQIQAQEEGE